MLRIGAAAAVVALAAALTACKNSRSAGGPPAMPPTPVSVEAAQATSLEDASEYVATLKSLRSTTVQPQTDGQITQIFVKSGDRVGNGAPLFQIDARRQQAAVASQQAELAAKEANVNFARQQVQRSSELYKVGAISKQELEQAETALHTAEADSKALQAQVQQQQVQLRYFTVTAPTRGIVGDVPVRVGYAVTPQTVLTTIDQNELLEVYVNVPIERAEAIKNGLPIRVLSSDGTQTLATTTVSFISPHVDDQTQSILVKGIVRNSDNVMRASQFVRARIIWKTAEGLVVPVTAVLRINGQFFAFVAQDEGGKLVAKQRAIKVGPIASDHYPVLEGIKPGERVVTSGAQKLADGAPIAAQPAPPAPGGPGTKDQGRSQIPNP
jgi:RND family efflux transporter MFP subunit